MSQLVLKGSSLNDLHVSVLFPEHKKKDKLKFAQYLDSHGRYNPHFSEKRRKKIKKQLLPHKNVDRVKLHTKKYLENPSLFLDLDLNVD